MFSQIYKIIQVQFLVHSFVLSFSLMYYYRNELGIWVFNIIAFILLKNTGVSL